MDKNIFSEARNFANLLLQTKEGKKFLETKNIFESNSDAFNKFKQYKEIQNQFKLAMLNNKKDENYENQKKLLNTLIKEINQNKIITDFLTSEKSFNTLVSNVIQILNYTIYGKIEEGCDGCGGCKNAKG